MNRTTDDLPRPLISLFALPKPFTGESRLLQENALSSWSQLGHEVQLMLAGDDEGVEQAASKYGADYLGPLRKNEQGTPFVDHLFELAHGNARGELLLYTNADILFFPDLLEAARDLTQQGLREFLAIGRRWDLDVHERVPRDASDWKDWHENARLDRELAPMVCKDYFLFSRQLYSQVPNFLVGRGNWDNWMVYQAKTSGVPVVDLTKWVTAIHQNHGYGHSGGRLATYVPGSEARHNERVGGGRHVISGAGANWELTRDRQLNQIRPHWRFVRDLPKFFGLLKSFMQRSPKGLRSLSSKEVNTL